MLGDGGIWQAEQSLPFWAFRWAKGILQALDLGFAAAFELLFAFIGGLLSGESVVWHDKQASLKRDLGLCLTLMCGLWQFRQVISLCW